MDEIGLKILYLISKGAEAHIYKATYLGYQAVYKKRVPKPYRSPVFDRNLRVRRTINEARILYYMRKFGIPAPTLFDYDTVETSITMEYIEGEVLEEKLRKKPGKEYVKEVFVNVGEILGKIHLNGIAHGDFTTSNIIVVNDKLPVIIDFGLSRRTNDIEEFAIDLHLMFRSLESTHYDIVDVSKESVLEGYVNVVGEDFGRKIYNKVLEIRRRGRYVKERKKK